MKYDSLKKLVMITPWRMAVNKAVKQREIYWVFQITKPSGEKEMTFYTTPLEFGYLDNPPTDREIKKVINTSFKNLQKDLLNGQVTIYSSLYPDRDPRIEKFIKLKTFKNIPEAYKDSLIFYFQKGNV